MVDQFRQDAPPATPPSPEIPSEARPAESLEQRLQAAEQQLALEHEQLLRALAETENVRRRAQNDIANAHKYGVEKMVNALLPVRDSLEAALSSAGGADDAIRNGVELTLKQLDAAFEKFQIAEVNPVGEKFDPHRHQAMSMIDADQPANTVVQVFQKGYLLADRVLRPALVAVAKPKPVETHAN
jgi:molecular chaperone GrpE